jgi:hypothetical protein
MKVIHWFLAAVIGVTLPASSVLASDDQAKHVRGGGADAVAPLEGGGDGEEEADRGLTTSCGPLSNCGTHLHFCTKSMFLASNCEEDWYRIVDPGPSTICAIGEPTVIVAAHLQECTSEIGSVLFEVTRDGKTIRRFAEKDWPYTVFGDAPSNPLAVTTRQLKPGAYTLRLTIKDPNRCVTLVQDYQFTVDNCG